MFAIENDNVLLCRNKIPTIVSGADTIVTSRSAAQSANNKGFFTRVVDCEQREMSKVEFPQTPLNTTMPYSIINASSDKELSNSPFTSSNMPSSKADKFSEDELDFVTVASFRVVFLIVSSFEIHCFSSILRAALYREYLTTSAMKEKIEDKKYVKRRENRVELMEFHARIRAEC